MREIKFRAWDGQNKTTYPHHNMYYWEGTGLGQAKPWWIEDDTPIMQYTGLKDKNGKEIYEGDIVKYKDGATDFEFTAPIVFNSGCFRADTILGMRAFYFSPEILGNIYETPELLEIKA
jgi:uncharacterized phage protein (TIGR01671 family)